MENICGTVEKYLDLAMGRPGCCGVCEFFLRLGGTSYEKVQNFARRMPKNMVGISLVALYVQELSGCSDRTLAVLDPDSILLHLMLGLCRTVVGSTDSSVVVKAISAVGQMEAISAGNVVNKQEIKRLVDGAISTLALILHGVSRGGCSSGYVEGSRCIYSNPGNYNEMTSTGQLGVDARWLVNPDFPPNKAVFFSDVHYTTGQPGFAERAEFGGEYTLGIRLGEWPAGEDLGKKHADAVERLHQSMDILYKLHGITHSGWRSKFTTFFDMPACLWCSLCILPGLHRVVFDLMEMGRRRVTNVGINGKTTTKCGLSILTGKDWSNATFSYGAAKELEEEAQKNVKTTKTLRAKGRPKKKHREAGEDDDIPSMRLDDMGYVPLVALETVADMWLKEKYPFLFTWINDHVSDANIVEEIWSHCSSTQTVACVTNSRSMLFDTDVFFKANHVCFLPFWAKLGAVLQNLEKLPHGLEEKMQKITACHHIHYSFSSVGVIKTTDDNTHDDTPG